MRPGLPQKLLVPYQHTKFTSTDALTGTPHPRDDSQQPMTRGLITGGLAYDDVDGIATVNKGALQGALPLAVYQPPPSPSGITRPPGSSDGSSIVLSGDIGYEEHHSLRVVSGTDSLRHLEPRFDLSASRFIT